MVNCKHLTRILGIGLTTFRVHYHHHGQALDWSAAISTSCLHRPRSWACRHAEFSPWLSGWRSASRVHSQVWRGRPGRRLQSLASPQIDVCRALNRSCESLILATCTGLVQRLAAAQYCSAFLEWTRLNTVLRVAVVLKNTTTTTTTTTAALQVAVFIHEPCSAGLVLRPVFVWWLWLSRAWSRCSVFCTRQLCSAAVTGTARTDCRDAQGSQVSCKSKKKVKLGYITLRSKA